MVPGPLPSCARAPSSGSPGSPARSRRRARVGPPQRIVALAPSAAEILFALGAADRVVGVSDFAADLPGAAGKVRLGGFAPDLERIVALAPDLVVVSRDGTDRAAYENARRARRPRRRHRRAASLDGRLRRTSGASAPRSARRRGGRAARGRAVGARRGRRGRGRRPDGAARPRALARHLARPAGRRRARDVRRRPPASGPGSRTSSRRSAGEWPRVSHETLVAWNPRRRRPARDAGERRRLPRAPSAGEAAGASSRPCGRGASSSSREPGSSGPGPRLVDALEALVATKRAGRSCREAHRLRSLRRASSSCSLLAAVLAVAPRRERPLAPGRRARARSSGAGDPATVDDRPRSPPPPRPPRRSSSAGRSPSRGRRSRPSSEPSRGPVPPRRLGGRGLRDARRARSSALGAGGRPRLVRPPDRLVRSAPSAAVLLVGLGASVGGRLDRGRLLLSGVVVNALASAVLLFLLSFGDAARHAGLRLLDARLARGRHGRRRPLARRLLGARPRGPPPPRPRLRRADARRGDRLHARRPGGDGPSGSRTSPPRSSRRPPVAHAGIIGFVGLLVPHVVRRLVARSTARSSSSRSSAGARPPRRSPTSLARTLFAPTEISSGP